MRNGRARLRVLAVTPGCPASVGPAVSAAAVLPVLRSGRHAVLVAGAAEPFLAALHRLGWKRSPQPHDDVGTPPSAPGLLVLDTQERSLPAPGRPSRAGDLAAAHALDAVLDMAVAGHVDAVATGPVRKQVFDHVRGGPFPGHTELFHARLGISPRPVMLFLAPAMRMALHTIHVPLKDVAAHVTRGALLETLRVLHDGLVLQGVPSPRVDVLGLNPHAGEDGRLGHEERDHVIPALQAARANGIRVAGPFPADGYMASYLHMARVERPAAVLAMFHDQGLAAFKLLERRRGFQVTLGLRVPRAACDHGTAYDLAASGSQADARSMTAAVRMALKMAGGPGRV